MNAKPTSQPHLIISSFLSRLSRACWRLVIAGILILSAALFATAELAAAHTDTSPLPLDLMPPQNA